MLTFFTKLQGLCPVLALLAGPGMVCNAGDLIQRFRPMRHWADTAFWPFWPLLHSSHVEQWNRTDIHVGVCTVGGYISSKNIASINQRARIHTARKPC